MTFASFLVTNASYHTSAIIQIEQKFENKRKDVNPSDTFEYILKASDAETPMPAGSTSDGMSFVMDGNEIKELSIEFDSIGVYSYTVQQIITNQDGYTLDDEIYTIRIDVVNDNGGLKAKVRLPINQNGEKESSITFTNSFYKEDTLNDSDKPINTGDTSQMYMWTSITTFSLSGLLLLIYMEYKLNKGGKEE